MTFVLSTDKVVIELDSNYQIDMRDSKFGKLIGFEPQGPHTTSLVVCSKYREMYSNSKRKTRQIAQIRHLEPQK